MNKKNEKNEKIKYLDVDTRNIIPKELVLPGVVEIDRPCSICGFVLVKRSDGDRLFHLSVGFPEKPTGATYHYDCMNKK